LDGQNAFDNRTFHLVTNPAMDQHTLTIIIVTLALIVVALLSREWRKLEKRLDDHSQKIRLLELANKQRIPHKSFEEILNAMVALDKEIEERNFQTSLLENAKGHLTNAMAVGTKREQ
jgi:hypothetical protein